MLNTAKALGISALLAAGAATGVVFSTAATAESTESRVLEGARSPELVLVKFHADWCPNCRRLNPVWDEVQKANAESDVLFVKLDRTDNASKLQAEYHSAELGIGQHWPAFGNRTGLIVLFDAESGRVVREFSAADSASTITAAIEDARG